MFFDIEKHSVDANAKTFDILLGVFSYKKKDASEAFNDEILVQLAKKFIKLIKKYKIEKKNSDKLRK